MDVPQSMPAPDIQFNTIMNNSPSGNDAGEWAKWSSDFQLAMFAVNAYHAANNSLVQTMQGIADRVANT